MQYHSDLSGHCRRSGPAGIADGQQTGPPAADPCKIASPATAWWAVNLIGVKCARVHRKDRAGEQQGGLGDRRAGPRQGARRTPPNSKGRGANTPRGQHSRPRDRTNRDRRHAAPAARREETLSTTRPQGAQGTARTRRPRRLSTDGALRRTQKAIALEGHRRHAPTPHRQHRPPHMLADACRPGHSRQRQSAGAPTTTTNMYMCE